MYYIYVATNIVTNKSYVGRTLNFLSRMKSHMKESERESSLFHKALTEYGIEKFIWRVVKTTEDPQIAKDMEENFISHFNTLEPNGYNVSRNSGGGNAKHMIPVVRLTLDGEYVKRYECINDTEKDGFWASAVQKTCNHLQRESGGYIFMFEDEYLKTGPKKYEKPVPRTTQCVYQCDLDGNLIQKFNSVVEAADATRSNRTAISGCLKGRYKTANGFIFVYPENFPIKDIESHKKGTKGHKIYALNIETGAVEMQFDKIKDAGRYLGKDYRGIQKVIDKPSRSAYGYKWISQ